MTPAPRRALRWVAVAVATAALAGCSTAPQASGVTTAEGERRLTGTFTITVLDGSDTPCDPIPDRPDLTDGAPVVITDLDDNVLTTGTLGTGASTDSACVRSLEVPSVPAISSYQVQIGSYGPIEVTADALDVSGNRLDLRIGV